MIEIKPRTYSQKKILSTLPPNIVLKKSLNFL